MRRLACVVSVVAIVTGACVPEGPPGGGTTTTTATTTTTTPPGSTDVLVVGGETVTVSAPPGTTVDAVSVDGGTVPAPPSGVAFPLGPIGVTVSGVAPGAIVHVDIAFESPVDAFLKLIEGEWSTFGHDGTTGATLALDGLSVALDLQDGGRGDSDGIANGVVVDPCGLGVATSLTIPSGSLPVAAHAVPYSHQLQAVAAAGPVTWSIIWGALPAGMSMNANGLITGTSNSSVGLFRVQADDGTTTTTRLLALLVTATISFQQLGTPYPDGSRISVTSWDPALCCSGPVGAGVIIQSGAYHPFATMSVARVRTSLNGGSSVSPDGTLVLVPDSGETNLLDANTGEELLTPTPLPPMSGPSFSPDGSVVAGFTSTDLLVIDTTTWATVRSIPWSCCGGPIVWSPLSDEIATNVSTAGQPTSIAITSVGEPADDRTIQLVNQNCTLGDWSGLGRLALTCPEGLTTVSAADGQSLRLVAPSNCFVASPCSHYISAPRYSPAGDLIVTSRSHIEANGTVRKQLVIGYDLASTNILPYLQMSTEVPSAVSWR